MLPSDPTATPEPAWFALRERLFDFFGTQAGWARWQDPEAGVWIAGPEKLRGGELVREARVAAIVRDRRSIPSRSMPEHHAIADLSAGEWNRLLHGVFTFLAAPARLDDLVIVVGALLRVPGAADLKLGHPLEPAD